MAEAHPDWLDKVFMNIIGSAIEPEKHPYSMWPMAMVFLPIWLIREMTDPRRVYLRRILNEERGDGGSN